MSATITDVDGYAARVRAALSDLPATDREALIPDLEGHLAEVAAEGELTELLGAPEQYAAELRSSAGLPPVGRPAGRRRWAWLRAVREFLPQLRPAWWVLRGLVSAGLVGLVLSGGLLLGLLLAVAAVPASVMLGQRAARDPGLRWADLTASVVSVLAVLLSIGLIGSTSTVGSSSGEVAPQPAGRAPGLSEVTNLYPYSSDGTPLRDVQLYDQNGDPVELSADPPGAPIVRYPRQTRDGGFVDNVYPQRQAVEDQGYGTEPAQQPVPSPEVSAPVLAPR